MEAIIHSTIFVDYDDGITDEEILKAIEQNLPGTTVLKTVRGGKQRSAVIDGVDMSAVTHT